MTDYESQMDYIFRCDPNPNQKTHHPDTPSQYEPYIASPELIETVNLAIYLRRPLLLEGEPGCGKTRLAWSIAFELGLPLYTWFVKSSSKAGDGLYSYDPLLRLHDMQLIKSQNDVNIHENSFIQGRNPSDARAYRAFGPIGKAFCIEECPAVVLIDEIDKADLDFPNDLLSVLDEPWSFVIPETGETIKAKQKPIIIITSNREKGNLPQPFLRRCLYYYIPFPNNEKQLEEIIKSHFGEIKIENDFMKSAINKFLSLRGSSEMYKRPSTSEFLDWLQALCEFPLQDKEITARIKKDRVPLPSLLLKTQHDWDRFAQSK